MSISWTQSRGPTQGSRDLFACFQQIWEEVEKLLISGGEPPFKELLSGLFYQCLMSVCDETKDRLGFVPWLVLNQGVILGLWGLVPPF